MPTTQLFRARSIAAIVASFTLVVSLAGSALADGPPPATLAPAPSPESSDSLAARTLAEFDAAAYRATRAPKAGHPLLRKVALASALGFGALALWRESVASDRARDYERAILPESAESLRESVRDAERERNLLATLSGTGFTLVVLTFVY